MTDALKINLLAYPRHMQTCFALLAACGATHYALFGGAVRDTDCAARYNIACAIKDYDIRIWMTPERWDDFLARVARHVNAPLQRAPAPGTDRLRYLVQLNGHELDLSFGNINVEQMQALPINAVAIDRIFNSDIALSAVAIDPTGQAWARKAYSEDRDNKTLTVYPGKNCGKDYDLFKKDAGKISGA